MSWLFLITEQSENLSIFFSQNKGFFKLLSMHWKVRMLEFTSLVLPILSFLVNMVYNSHRINLHKIVCLRGRINISLRLQKQYMRGFPCNFGTAWLWHYVILLITSFFCCCSWPCFFRFFSFVIHYTYTLRPCIGVHSFCSCLIFMGALSLSSVFVEYYMLQKKSYGCYSPEFLIFVTIVVFFFKSIPFLFTHPSISKMIA